MNKNFDIQFKILVIGDSACGKTSTILRYTNDLFSPTFITTIGIDFKIKYMMHNNKNIKLIIWDTAGQERFRTITTSYFRNAQALIVMYSVDNRSSFENIKNWIDEIYKYVEKSYYVLVANKIDIDDCQREVSQSDGMNLAKLYKIPYFEISAKKGINVNLPFEHICKKLYEKSNIIPLTSKIEKSNVMNINIETKPKSSCCK